MTENEKEFIKEVDRLNEKALVSGYETIDPSEYGISVKRAMELLGFDDLPKQTHFDVKYHCNTLK